MTQTLTIHPQAEKINGENRQLQTGLARLVVERDRLRQTIVPHIQAEYTSKIGVLEWRVFQMDCETRAMLRRIEMARTMLNRGDQPCYKCIEEDIEAEFAAWCERIKTQAKEIKDAKQRLDAPTLSRAESRELQTIYRKLAFLLHPDIVGDGNDKRHKLWLQTAEAYKNGDLQTLRTIRLIVGDNAETPENFSDEKDSSLLETLRNRQAELKKTCENLLEEINEIKATVPYIWHKILDDDEAISERQNELHRQISILREQRQQMTTAWAEIMRFAKDREAVVIPDEPPDLFAANEEDWAEIIYE